MQTTTTYKGWPLLLATGLVFILQIISPAQIWTMLLIGLGLLQLLAYFWAKSLENDFTLLRERRYNMAQVGDRIEERFTLSKEGFFPAVWVEVIDYSTMPGYTTSMVTGLGMQSRIRWQTENHCTQRGVYRLGPTEVNLGDPFGLFTIQQTYPKSIDFTVAPPIIDLPQFAIASRGHIGEGSPRRFSLAPTEPTASVRQYRPSDSLNRVHWPTSARREDLYVRSLQETTSGDWWFVLDMDQRVHNGTDPNSTLEKGVLLTASLTDRGLQNKQSVGLLAHGEEAVWLPPKNIELQRWRILTALAKIQAGDLSLTHLLTRSVQLIKQNTSLIIITPSTDVAWLDPLLLIKRQGVVPTIFSIFTPETQGQAEAFQQNLIRENIQTHLIDETAIIPPSLEATTGRWEWRTLSTGKIVAKNRPEGAWEHL